MPFPKLHVTGGPHAKNLKIEMDGVAVPSVSRAEIVLDVNDAARLRLWQVIEADLDIVAGSVERKFKLRVMAPVIDTEDFTRTYTEIGEFEGGTIEAVFDAAAVALADFVPAGPTKPLPVAEATPDA